MKKRMKALIGVGIAVVGAGLYKVFRYNHRAAHEWHPQTDHLITKKELKQYRKLFMEDDPNQNLIFSQNIGLSLNNYRTNRSLNVLVLGSAGTGKTNKYVKPNILQQNCSMLINDPTNGLFEEFAPYLLKQGYHVYHLDLTNPDLSSHYNPLMHLYDDFGNISEVKVDVLVDLLMYNAQNGKEEGSGDPYWEKAERALLTAVIFYVLENDEIPKIDKCFHTVLDKIKLLRNENRNILLTKEIKSWQEKCEREGRKVKAPNYYDTFLIAPQKTINAVAMTAEMDLQLFEINDVDFLTRYVPDYEQTDLQIDFDDFAQVPSVIFTNFGSNRSVYPLISNLFFQQFYARLYELGERTMQDKWFFEKQDGLPVFTAFDNKEEAIDFAKHISERDIVKKSYINSTDIYYLTYKGKIYQRSYYKDTLKRFIKSVPDLCLKCNNNYPKLPIYVNCLLDKFESIGEIPNFLTILSTSRKYRIGSHIIIQNMAQLRVVYNEYEYITLLANVDSMNFFGTILNSDKELVQQMCGKVTKNQESLYYDDYVLSMDELNLLNQNGRDDCVVMIRDVPTAIDEKYDIKAHPKYEEYKEFKASERLALCRIYNSGLIRHIASDDPHLFSSM